MHRCMPRKNPSYSPENQEDFDLRIFAAATQNVPKFATTVVGTAWKLLLGETESLNYIPEHLRKPHGNLAVKMYGEKAEEFM